MIVTEAIYEVRESHNFPRTFSPYFMFVATTPMGSKIGAEPVFHLEPASRGSG